MKGVRNKLRILLFSDSEKVFELTQNVTKDLFELIWCKYDELLKEEYPISDIVIIDFDKNRIQEGVLQSIMRVKCKLKENIPILIIIQGTPQKIFSALKAGAYDYIVALEDLEEYKKKIGSIALWNWYQKKYGEKVSKNKSL